MSWQFQKFPRTPHLPGSSGAELRSEKLLRPEEVERICTERVTVEEKLDGANLGISFDGDQPRFQNRGKLIETGHTPLQFQALYSWFGERRDALHSALGQRYLLFGEWMFARHSVAYDALPDLFLAFDVWDRDARAFGTVAKRAELCERMGIRQVPLLFEGVLGSLDPLAELLAHSRCGHEPAEGLYVRLEENGHLALRAKFVRPGWITPDEIHWSKRALEPNGLSPELESI